MSDSQPQQPEDLPNIEHLRQLAQLMEEHELSELDLRQNDYRIRLRRGALSEAAQHYTFSAPAADSLATSKEQSQPTSQGGVEENVAIIKSPMVGTFYGRPNPESETYVKVGDHVGPDSIVCVIEAMKVFNDIPAEVSGRVIAILVDNEEPVEFGKPLFKIDTSG